MKKRIIIHLKDLRMKNILPPPTRPDTKEIKDFRVLKIRIILTGQKKGAISLNTKSEDKKL